MTAVPPARQSGQATVELALVLPMLVAILLVLVEGGLVVRDQVLVVHAAREAARAAAVEGDTAAVDAARVAAAEGTGLESLEVLLANPAGADRVTATVRYRVPGRVPLLTALTSRLTLSASATMRVEGPP